MLSILGCGLFEIEADTYVIPTNCVGPMGAGLARVARDKIPGLEFTYRSHCKRGQIEPGRLLLYRRYRQDPDSKLWKSEKTIICFPTKRHWRDEALLEDVALGLGTLAKFYGELGTIALPPLGCGLGGLDWESQVYPVVYEYLGRVPGSPMVCTGTGDPGVGWLPTEVRWTVME